MVDSAGIASPEEVLETLTAVLRGEKSADALKAAEQLAKHLGMLSPRDGADKARVAQEIEAALQAMEARRDGS